MTEDQRAAQRLREWLATNPPMHGQICRDDEALALLAERIVVVERCAAASEGWPQGRPFSYVAMRDGLDFAMSERQGRSSRTI